MNIADIIVMVALLAILTMIVYATRPKKGEGSGYGSRHSNCSSYSAFSNLYGDYRGGQEQK